MTVSTTNSVYSYDGDGVTVAFSFPRYAQSSAQILAKVVDETTGVETSPTYTVSGSASSWTVTFATAPASTTKVVLYRDPSLVQETSFASEGDPLAAMTAKADLLTMQLQALRNRALRMGDGTLQDFDPKLPNPTGAAGFSLVVNDDGDGFEFAQELADGAVVSAAMAPVIAGTVANAVSLLGVAPVTYLDAITSGGGTTAYTLTSGRSLAAYVSGQSFLIKMNATNTGASTLNVDSLGAKNITKNGTTALASGDLVSGQIYRVAYDGTQFQVVGVLSGVYQALDATLTALAALSFSGPGIIQATASDTFTARAIGGFRANKGGSNQTAGITTATNSKVTFTTESWDTGSYYDTTNSRWTPPSGKVRISATVRCENLTGDPVVAYVYKNGSQAAVGPLYVRSGTAGRASVDFVDNANGTDYYEIYIYMVSSGTPTVIGGADESYFSGESVLG